MDFLRYFYVPAAGLAMVALVYFTFIVWRKKTPAKALWYWGALTISNLAAFINGVFLK